MKLDLATGLKLPIDAATQTFLIVGKRGSGKSNTAVRLAEQFYRAGVPFVTIDPVDNWYGLKSSGDGKGPGLAVHVFGGPHGDLPLEPTAGSLLADVIVEHRISAVLSVKHFSVRERGRFVGDFTQRLFQRNKEPLHVFLEEAHEVAPQNPYKGEEEMLGHVTRIWKLGRSSGLGGSAVSQRPASLSKNITTQAEILIVHRTLGPQDVAAIKEWIKYHGEREEILGQLSTLKTGEAFVWAPDFPEGKPIGLQRVMIGRRETFDSAATPKAGEKRVEPKALAKVDIDQLAVRMAATIEKAKADDPRALRTKVAELEKENARLTARSGDTEYESGHLHAKLAALEKELSQTKRTEVRVFTPDDQKLVKESCDALIKARKTIADDVHALLHRLDGMNKASDVLLQRLTTVVERAAPQTRKVVAILPKPMSVVHGTMLAAASEAAQRHIARENGQLNRGAREMLKALVRMGPLTRAQVATLAGLSQSGTFRNYLSDLRGAGYVTESGETLTATRDGIEAAGPVDASPITTADLVTIWNQKLDAGARRMLDALVQRYPRSFTRADLAATVSMEESGTFRNYLSDLCSNGLADKPTKTEVRASASLFLGEA